MLVFGRLGRLLIVCIAAFVMFVVVANAEEGRLVSFASDSAYPVCVEENGQLECRSYFPIIVMQVLPTPIPTPTPSPTPIVLTVNNTNDGGAGSLRQAISDAPSGATIDIQVNGEIRLTSGRLFINKPLIIQGPGSNLLTIHGNNQDRVLDVYTDGAVVLSGITVSGGEALKEQEFGIGVRLPCRILRFERILRHKGVGYHTPMAS